MRANGSLFQILPEPKDERQAVAAMFSIMANVSIPFGAPHDESGTYNTEYRSVMNLTDRVYYFQLTAAPCLCWTRMPELHLSKGSPVMALNPDSVGLTGDAGGSELTILMPYGAPDCWRRPAKA